MAIIIRPAHLDEAKEIAAFHVRIWRETYLDIAPPVAIEKLDVQHRLPVWQRYLGAPKPCQHTLVAVDSGAIVGLVSFGPPSHPVFGTCGEVKHLYVDQAYKRQGIGRRLMHVAIRQMANDGFKGAALAMAEGNTKALNFYAAIGGVQDGRFIDLGPIWKSKNLIFKWDNILPN